MWNSHKLKEYKPRCKKIKIEILSSMICDSFILELFWYKHSIVIVEIKENKDLF